MKTKMRVKRNLFSVVSYLIERTLNKAMWKCRNSIRRRKVHRKLSKVRIRIININIDVSGIGPTDEFVERDRQRERGTERQEQEQK